MKLNILTASALVAGAAAYPSVTAEESIGAHLEKRAVSSKTETNAGFFPNKGFNAKDQFVDVSPGSGHEFQAPKSDDIRGPCPGLNAAANHGFADHSGVFSYHDTTKGLGAAYALGEDFSNILFVFSVFNSGSILDGKWSIGGPFKSSTLGVLGKGMGLSNSHNKYEGDSSPGRGDAYVHNGDAHSLNIPNYMNLLAKAKAGGDDYNFEQMRKHIVFTHEFSLKNNPYAFFGPGFFVAPIAHEFVTAFMSNHSAEQPGGYLPEHILNSFFSVKKSADGTLTWVPGHDRIPENWYRRPSSNPYGAAAAVADLALTIKENPEIGDIGGNLGKPNTFAGIEVEDLTSGVFNGPDLLKGNNLACFAIQGLIIGIPGASNKLLSAVTPFTKLANKALSGFLDKFTCPQLTEKDYKLNKFNKYPGFTYRPPIQPATPY